MPAGRQPLYKRIKNELTDLMRNGHYARNERLPNECELAKVWNVNRHTLRRALEELAREGWVDRRKRTGTFVRYPSDAPGDSDPSQLKPTSRFPCSKIEIGTTMVVLMCPTSEWLPESWFSRMAENCQEVLHEAGIEFTVRVTGRDHRLERKHLKQILANPVAGVITWPMVGIHNTPLYRRLQEIGTPVISIDRRIEGLLTPYVGFDNYRAARLATEHLITLGHTRILFLETLEATHSPSQGYLRPSSIQERLLGFLSVMTEAGLEPIVLPADRPEDEKSGASSQNGKDFLHLLTDVTAIIASSCRIGLPILAAFAKAGLRCPDDRSFVVLGDSINTFPFAPVTHVALPVDEMAQQAAQLLLHHTQRPSARYETRTLPVTFVRGQTSGAVRASLPDLHDDIEVGTKSVTSPAKEIDTGPDFYDEMEIGTSRGKDEVKKARGNRLPISTCHRNRDKGR